MTKEKISKILNKESLEDVPLIYVIRVLIAVIEEEL